MTALQGAAFPDGTTPHYQDLSLNDWRSAPGERHSRRGSDPPTSTHNKKCSEPGRTKAQVAPGLTP